MWQVSRRQDIKPLFGGNFAQLPICRYKGHVIAEKVQGDCELNTVHRLHVSLQNEVFRFDDVIGGEIQDRYAERANVLVKEGALLQELFLGRDLIDLVKPPEVGDHLDDRYGGIKVGWSVASRTLQTRAVPFSDWYLLKSALVSTK